MTTYKDNNGGIWFPAIETARILQFRNPKMAVINNVSVRDTAMFYEITDNDHGVQNFVPRADRVKKLMNEKAWWKLAMRSNALIAEELQDWVFGEVLPGIRTQGFYAIPGALPKFRAITDADFKSIMADEQQTKELRNEMDTRRDQIKDQKMVELGKLGGHKTQQRRRDMITKIDELKDDIETLKEENDELFESNEVLSEETARLTYNESRLLDKIQKLEIELDGLRNLAFDYAETLDYQTEVIKEMETKINSKSDEKESDDPKNGEPSANPLPPPNEEGL